MAIRIIGDVHCKLSQYYSLVTKAQERNIPSIQIGDLCTQHSKVLNLGPHHKFFCGNHDDYETKHPNNLGDYGLIEIDGRRLFFIRGAFSLGGDARRRLGYHWAPKEELDQQQQGECWKKLQEIQESGPIDIMLTHEAPRSIANIIGDDEILRSFGFNPDTFTTKTSEFLEKIRQGIKKPKLWIFGHYHKHFDQVVDGTRFICLPELGHIEV